MHWLVICLPLMIIGIAVATVPLLLVTRHQHEHDLHEGPRPRAGMVARSHQTVADSSSWTVCSDCSAVVADLETHKSSAHVLVTT